MKKIFLVLTVTFLLIFSILLSACNPNLNMGEVKDGLGSFSSRDELINRIKSFSKSLSPQNSYLAEMDGSSKLTTSQDSINDGVENDYTTTNIQIEGIDEGDIVKVDENHIYIQNHSGCYIIQANNGDPTILSSISIENYAPQEMYVNGNFLILVGGSYKPETIRSPRIDFAARGFYWKPYTNIFDVRVYDVSDKTSPTLLRHVEVEGSLNTTRLYGGHLYFVLDYYFQNNNDDMIPRFSDSKTNAKNEEISHENIFFFDSVPALNYMIIGKIKIDGSTSLIKAYLAGSGTIYMSKNNIFSVSEDFSERAFLNNKNYLTYDYSKKPKSKIIRFSNSDLDFNGKGQVEGLINDRFSIDEYDDYLRIATSTFLWGEQEKQYSSLFILDSELKEVSKISNIAPGERIYSARFNKTEAVIVTFQQVDPLYKINLEDPLDPQISEGLKKDGVSFYLQYIENTDFVIGLGYDTEETKWGVTWKGIEVTLFDNSKDEAEIINQKYIGSSYSYAEAIYNPRAILYDNNLKIFAFAAEAWDMSSSESEYMSKQGFYVFSFENDKLELLAVLTDISDTNEYFDSKSYINLSFNHILRGARIGGYLYTISNNYVSSYSLSNFEKIKQLALPNIDLFL